MANATKHHLSHDSRGKGDGSGAMAELPDGLLGENQVLSNRDKALHSDERGLDGKAVQSEQYHDHAGNRRNFAPEAAMEGDDNVSGLTAPKTNASGKDSSLKSQQS
ncbi:hypothetical protein NPA31_007805 [Aurantimonas sp. MSK8Z-1]|uniref:hypothetical protein n=1 Tax=Mangrovibrevibacter kandeliae TaxID=2968473 RepID=UPI002118C813|nr:hypothetical protein [Aurantimonas sp. MSK8Z-1]MCW4114862.1 hypothetical protein [Aurantimonas sp. MSK8Z-1]